MLLLFLAGVYNICNKIQDDVDESLIGSAIRLVR